MKFYMQLTAAAGLTASHSIFRCLELLDLSLDQVQVECVGCRRAEDPSQLLAKLLRGDLNSVALRDERIEHQQQQQ